MAARELLDPDSSLWDWIAYDLRRYRVKHEMSGSQLGKVMDCTRHTVSNLEAGRPGFRLNEKQAKAIDALWDTGGHFLRLLRLAKAGHDTDWFRQFTGYEARASVIQMYGGQLVPALLQTPDYARALLVAGRNADIEGDFEKRMARQELLSKPNPPDLWVLLSESVLDWPVGGTEVMKEQLARLLELSDLPHVTLRVVPKSAGAHEGLDGPFKVITVEEGDIAFVDAPERRETGDGHRRGPRPEAEVRPNRGGSTTRRLVAESDQASDGDHEVTSPIWRKSSRSSDGTSGQCVEVAQLRKTVGVRDSKQPNAGHLSIRRDQFAALVKRVKRNELDL